MNQAQVLERKATLNSVQADREFLKREALRSLSVFTQLMWPVIEPGQPYIHGWHIDAICKHLEAAAEFKIKRLLINMPPRHMKSILVNVMFPAWVWLKNPERRFICASYGQDLSIRDGTKQRTIIDSHIYQDLFRPEWSLKDDQNQKKKFDTTAMGFRMSTSVEGQVTGEGGDFLIVDDPLNAMEAESEVTRDGAIRWLKTVMSSRANNAKRHCRIMVMQRLHDDDPSGHVLRDEKGVNAYESLILQARYESKPRVRSRTSLGFIDPRLNDGDLLWPERFDDAAINELAADLDSQGFGQSHAQLQQDPKPKEGGLFKRDWWQLYEKPPSSMIEVVQFWDCAQKPGITNDYSVCATWARTSNGFYLLDLWRDKVEAPILQSFAEAHYAAMRPDAVVIEDKSAGSSLIQYLLRETTIPVLPFDPGRRDKEVRATAATPTVQAKKCFLPKGIEWVESFIAEHERFPKGSNDDQVDTTSMMVEYFAKRTAFNPRIRSL